MVIHLGKGNFDKIRQIVWERGSTLNGFFTHRIFKEIEEYLPKLDKKVANYYYDINEAFLFKVVGNIHPHIDDDETDATLFILLDVIYPNEIGFNNSKVTLVTNPLIELEIYRPVIFDHHQTHAILSDLAWCAIAIPLFKDEEI